MAYALADCADSAGYIVGPLLGFTLCRVLRSRFMGLLVVGIGCTAFAPPLLSVGRLCSTKSGTPSSAADSSSHVGSSNDAKRGRC